MSLSSDTQWMERALELASKGRYGASPNPLVGAVVLNDRGELIGEGYHRAFGGPHAEIEALTVAGKRAAGGTLFVTLEPCAHHGKTPPCTDAILAARLKRVVVAIRDPNATAAGGIEHLRQAGLEVDIGTHVDDARELNMRWLTWVERRTPWVTAKIASSLDGRTATASGESKWITGEDARARGWALREEHDAIAVGVETVLADDPSLQRHLGLNPGDRWLRVVFDTRLRTPLGARIVQEESQQTLIVHGPEAPLINRHQLTDAGVQLLEVGDDQDGRVDVIATLSKLAALEISSLLVEGGATLHGSFFDHELVDEINLFLAPLVIGGRGHPSVAGQGIADLTSGSRYCFQEAEICGTDILLRALRTEVGDVHRPC